MQFIIKNTNLCLMLSLCIWMNTALAEKSDTIDCAQARALPATASKESRRIACQIPSDLQEKISNAEALGIQLRRHDIAAWKTSDTLKNTASFKKLPGEMHGWLSFNSEQSVNVRYYVKKDKAVFAFAEANMNLQTLRSDNGNEFRPLRNASPQELTMLQARNTAFQTKRLNCSGPFNSVIFPHKENNQEMLYVYLFSPWTDTIAPLGGHHLIKFDADGKKVISEFAQTKACLNYAPNTLKTMAAFMLSHNSSDTPTEMHVFMSLQYKKPIYVITPSNGITWRVQEDKIYVMERKDKRALTDPSTITDVKPVSVPAKPADVKL